MYSRLEKSLSTEMQSVPETNIRASSQEARGLTHWEKGNMGVHLSQVKAMVEVVFHSYLHPFIILLIDFELI